LINSAFLLNPHFFPVELSEDELYYIAMHDSSGTIPDLLTEIVGHARRGDSGAAASLLNKVVLLMQTALSSGTVQPLVLKQVPSFLGDLLAAQKRGDWVGFADILEYSFIDFWQKGFPESR
jgi:hypothetical protein